MWLIAREITLFGLVWILRLFQNLLDKFLLSILGYSTRDGWKGDIARARDEYEYSAQLVSKGFFIFFI